LKELVRENNMGGHPRFREITDALNALHEKKNSDYNPTEDPLSNFRMCESFGIEPWKGILVRITDKIARLQSFARKGKYLVDDEKIEDTLKDLATYSILCLIVYEEDKTK
jgi:hypothetical protein